jgi:hypothetical protein
LGPSDSRAEIVPWKWYYHASGAPLWLLVAALAALPKANRRPQAWLIFLPLIAVALGWRMLTRLFGIPDGDSDLFGSVAMSCAAGWAAFWLLGDWLAQRHGVLRFLAAAALMTGCGAISVLPELGSADTEELLAVSIAAGAFGSAMALGSLLAGRSCRNCFRCGRFMVLLLWWTVVEVGVGLGLLCSISFAVALGSGQPAPLMMLWGLAVFFLMFTGAIYLVNLPFMLLAFNSPFYASRFRSLFFPAATGWEDPRYVPPLSTEPTGKPVDVGDVVGTWRFYLDEASSTVAVEFRPDATFAETVLPNQGDARPCPGGTWRVAGPLVHLDNYMTAKDAVARQLTWWMIDTSLGLALFGGETTYFRMQRETPSPPLVDS